MDAVAPAVGFAPTVRPWWSCQWFLGVTARRGCRLASSWEKTMANFTWGDTVRVKAGAEPKRRPGAVAEVVGIRAIETESHAVRSDVPIGSKVYLVEFGDGTSVEIPEAWIESV
jgi:hypothetical protein